MSRQLEGELVKPILGVFNKLNQMKEKNDAELEIKNKQIKQLEIENTMYKTKKDTMAAILEEVRNLRVCDKQKELEKQVNSDAQRLIAYKKELESKNTNVQRLETIVQNLIPKQKEVEAKKQEISQLENIVKKRTEDIVELNEKISSEANKVIELNSILKYKTEIILSNDEKIKQLETENKHSIDRLKAFENSCFSNGNSTFKVECKSNIAGSGWTVIQQRINGAVDFRRDWTSYRNGFGECCAGDFFLGLEEIHRLTTEQPHVLYIHMEAFNGSTNFARYDEFAISGEDDQYRLIKLGAFSGTVENLLIQNINDKFSTYDRDHDKFGENCSTFWHAGTGWWFNACSNW